MAKRTALAVKPKNGAIVQMEPWEEEMQHQARSEAAKEITGMARIQHDNHGLKIDGQKVKDNKLPIIVIDYIFTKQYFKEKYVPGKAGTPDCYAYGATETELVPHP